MKTKVQKAVGWAITGSGLLALLSHLALGQVA
jgi:hypothetical protein